MRDLKIAAGIMGLMTVLAATRAGAEGASGNLDAGKTAAQMFGENCTVCHKSPRALKATSASFLREHYTTGSQEAAALANYLAGVGSDPKAVQDRKPAGSEPKGQPKPAQPSSSEQAALPPAQTRKPEQAKPAESARATTGNVPAPVLTHLPSTNAEGSKPVTAALSAQVRSAQSGAAMSDAAPTHLPEIEE